MQDDFNNAPTPAGLPIPPPMPAQPPDPATRPAGQPLGMINPQSPQPPHSPVQGAGQTLSYHGQVTLDPPTVANPQPPAMWPGTPGAVSPFDPTVRRPPSAPKPPVYQPGSPQAIAPALPAPMPLPAPLPAPAPRVPARAPARAVGAQHGGWSRWIPLPHTLLLLGVALLLVATFLPWGVDSSGNIIMLQTTSVPALAGQSGDGSALQVAYDVIAGVGALSVALLLSNIFLNGLHRLLGRGCVAGCVITPLYPILLALIVALVAAQTVAAGFGGLGALAQAPGAQSYGLAGLGVAHYELGYYVWYTGIMLNVLGMFGEMVVWRR